jgi:O-antigen ligase
MSDVHSADLQADILRQGSALLKLGLVLSITAAVGVAFLNPLAALAIPAFAALISFVAITAHRTDIHVVLFVAGGILLLPDTMSLHAGQMVHIAWFVTFLLFWTLSQLVNRRPVLQSTTDYLVLGLLVLGVLGGIVVGIVWGGISRTLFGEATALSILALYFPVKDACRRYPNTILLLAAALCMLALVTVVNNILITRAAIVTATQQWQIIDVRAPGNEVLLLIPAVIVPALLAGKQSASRRALLIGLLCIFFMGLIISKSRAYWVAWALGIVSLLILLSPDQRKRLILTLGLSLAGMATLAVIFLGDLAVALVSGSLNRLATLSTAFTADVSMLDRYTEQRALWERIKLNPILGYGFGTEYALYSIQSGGTRIWSYAHNGFLGLWYKTGFFGLLMMAVLWGQAVFLGVRTYRSNALPPVHRAVVLGASCAIVAIMLTIYTSGPFFHYASMCTITTCIAMVTASTDRI